MDPLKKEQEEQELLLQQRAERQRIEEGRKKLLAEIKKSEVLLAEEDDKQVFTVKGVRFEMIKVEGGTFWMGAQSKDPNGQNYDKEASDDESPVHEVTLSNYSIGEFPVTQELWKAVMGNNPSFFKGNDLPVEQVNWDDCQLFLKKLNTLTEQEFRLPKEAEWEYAARGSNKSKGYRYSGSNTIGNVAWYNNNSFYETNPIGQRQPNEIGIYDMSGNVWEWCQDYYRNSYHTNPTKALISPFRVLRGGSWGNDARNCRVSNRQINAPDTRSYLNGFRLAL